MKKKIVLISLLILPITAYIYFSMVKHNSLFLSTLVENVDELPDGTSLSGEPVLLENKISIVGFPGSDILKRKESLFNLNQKIANKYETFDDFQMVMLVPKGSDEQVEKVISDLKVMSDLSKWKFLFADPEQIAAFHSSLQTAQPLDADSGSFYVYIIDKKRNLRGRNGEGKRGKGKDVIDGYNTFSASELHNEMNEDVMILLREYRLALKKNEGKGVKRKI